MKVPPVFLINIAMENDRCWYELDIDTLNAFKTGYSLPDVTGRNFGIWWVRKDDIFDPSWIKYLSNKGIDIIGSMLFWRPAGFTNVTAHVDVGDGKTAGFALNWVIGGKDSEMSWYHLPPGPKPVEYTTAGTPFSAWPISQLVETDRRCIQSRMTLVRVDVPHAIFVKDEPRWCISLRTNQHGITWDRCVSFMQEKGLISLR
jgi:hypothetical protein